VYANTARVDALNCARDFYLLSHFYPVLHVDVGQSFNHSARVTLISRDYLGVIHTEDWSACVDHELVAVSPQGRCYLSAGARTWRGQRHPLIGDVRDVFTPLVQRAHAMLS